MHPNPVQFGTNLASDGAAAAGPPVRQIAINASADSMLVDWKGHKRMVF